VGDAEFDLKELCEQGRVTPRTVHFYVQQGLLPPAGAPGPGARYGKGHLARLKLIRLLQKEHLPLAEISQRIRGLNDDQVRALVEEARAKQGAAPRSALDYIRGVLSGEQSGSKAATERSVRFRASSQAPEAAQSILSHNTPAERSQWERLTLADGLEVHVRRPLARLLQRLLVRLLAAARAIFSSEGEE
jgi:DNA-binding transcriptional MerR regulator